MGEANRSEVASPTFDHTFSCDRLTGSALTGPLCRGSHWPAVYTVTLDPARGAQVLQPDGFAMETAAPLPKSHKLRQALCH